MGYLGRLAIALTGGLVALAMLVVFLAFLTMDEPAGRPAGDSDRARAEPSRATDAWLGRWNGPEGTFLLLEGGDGVYEITVQDLDGPRLFRGAAVGGEIRFERDGVQESLRPTDGAATGMKWLSDKADCLTIRSGEGFCRD